MKRITRKNFLFGLALYVVAAILFFSFSLLSPMSVLAGDATRSSKPSSPLLDKRIPAFDNADIKSLQKLNASHDNPFITIFDNKVVVSWEKGKHYKEAKLEDLAVVLSEIPLSAWPYGRAVGVTYCGIGNFSKDAELFRKNAWKSIEATLKRMKIYLNPWPCA